MSAPTTPAALTPAEQALPLVRLAVEEFHAREAFEKASATAHAAYQAWESELTDESRDEAVRLDQIQRLAYVAWLGTLDALRRGVHEAGRHS